LRDLLKFEFFFADKDEYRLELREELAGHDAGWESALSSGPEAIHALLRRCKPFSAHRILRPFLEAYRVVGDALERADPGRPVDETKFLATCLALGTQYRLQRRIHRTESISKVLFATALRLARNRDLVEPGAADLIDRRRAFATELRAVTRRIDAIDLLAASRLAGLIE
jgi:glycerol-3-phosphate O-acyltransferase